ncbi:hypothetical protein HYW82_00085 [Candidatus Peregrinibacteria bacterium]|nr:hypothetical protein [Candidatus Peregrinibacteria bacterium]
MPGQQNAHFETFYTNALSAIAAQNGVPVDQPKITKYRFVITEGAQYFDAQKSDFDYAFNNHAAPRDIEDCVNAFKQYLRAHTGILSLNATGFLMLMINGLRKGEPTGRTGETQCQSTILPGEPKSVHMGDDLVVNGGWNELASSAHFGGGFHGNGNLNTGDTIIRAAVMGEI